MSSKGVLLFAYNNKEIDYGKIAVCCSLAVKKHLIYNDVTLVTNNSTLEWLHKSLPEDIIDKSFNNIKVTNTPIYKSDRKHFDSPWTKFTAPFINTDHFLAYKYSPYDETLLMDVDYLVMSNSLDMVWGSNEDILVNRNAISLRNEHLNIKDRTLSSKGIPMWWATVVYFKKSYFVERLFGLIEHIYNEYSFYQFLYQFPPVYYRNDYSLSIAIHILNGYIENNEIKHLPVNTIKTMDQKDDIIKVDNNGIVFLCHSPEEPWKNILSRINGIDVHIMNKRALIRHSDKLIKVCI